MEPTMLGRVMDQLLRYLPVVSILVSFAVAAFLWKLRSFFVEKGENVTPLQLNEKLTDTFEKFKLAVITEINTKISTTGTENMMRYDSLDRNMADMRETLREIRQKVEKTDADAIEAKHSVHILEERFEGRAKLTDSRLSHCEERLERRRASSE